MSSVRVEPSEIAFTVEPDESVFAAATRHGYSWPTSCHGQGSCRACVLVVLEGQGHMSPIGPWEQEGLDAITPNLRGAAADYRLACQVMITGDIVVRKAGVGRPRMATESSTHAESK